MKNKYWKFFRKDEKAVVLAFDHGGGGDLWLNPGPIIEAAVAGGIDGILSTAGVLKNFRKEIGKIGTIQRLEVFGSALNTSPMSPSTPFELEDIYRSGVDGVMMMGYPGPDDRDNLRYVARVAQEADRLGLISAVEMLPNGFSSDPADRTIEKMNIACRGAAELGIDFVKTQFVGPTEEFKKVVDNCYVPILVLGGALVNDDRAVLENAKAAIDAGAKGLAIGRNLWGHKNITGMGLALQKIVHEDATVDEALKELA